MKFPATMAHRVALFGVTLLILLACATEYINGGLDQDKSSRRPRFAVTKKTQSELAKLSYENIEVEYGAASSLFNALHGSLRQFDASLYHNGMSVFPAVVPKGNILYHGRSNADKLTKMEWLAFEMEMANTFARPARNDRRRPGGPRGPREPAVQSLPGDASLHVSSEHTSQGDVLKQQVLQAEPAKSSGFVHTFRATRDWNLLYLDGMSAGKSSLGTMDLTDLLLEWGTDRDHASDYDRGQALCDWQRNNGYNLDGFIRTEICFEIIFCDFSSDAIELVRVVEKADAEEYASIQRFEWIRAAENEYDGLTGRVVLDYSSTVSAYALGSIASQLNYTDGLPRLAQIDTVHKTALRQQIDSMMAAEHDFTYGHDWQKTTDLIIGRYAKRLLELELAAMNGDQDAFDAHLSFILLHHSDGRLEADARRTSALESCIYEFLPTSLSSTMENALFSAVETVTTGLCVSFFHMHDDETMTITRKAEIILQLKQYLRWTTWLKCTSCQPDEVCFVTMWPFGNVEDRTPNCKSPNDLDRNVGKDYWGHIL